jgi:hypothetical protein
MSSFDKTLETLAPQDARKWQEFKSSDWKKIQEAVLTLFQQKRYPSLAQDLHQLNNKLGKLFRSEVGQFIGEFYQVCLPFIYLYLLALPSHAHTHTNISSYSSFFTPPPSLGPDIETRDDCSQT